MKLLRHSLAAAIAAACFTIAACHKDDQPARSGVDAATLKHAQEALVQPAQLRDHVPPGTVGYARISSPWAIIGAVPDGRALDVATASDANLKAIAALREAIAHDKLLADAGVTPYLLPLLVDLRSPIELLAVDPIGVMSPGTHVLVAMRLAQRTPAEVAARLATLPAPMRLAQPFDAQGNAMLTAGVPAHFDSATQQLYLLAGRQGVDATALATMLQTVRQAGVDTPAAKAMREDEQAIDSSGQGLFGWGSLRGVGSLATGAIPTDKAGTLPGDLLSKVDSIAFGAGSVDGHGTAQIRLRAPQARMLGYLAPSGFAPTFKVAGTPRWVANLALPGAAQWQSVEANLALDYGAERAAAWRQAMAQWSQIIGVSPAELTQWIGPELMAFEDDAGSFVALRVRDRKALYDRVGQLASAHGGALVERRIDGTAVHELTIPHGGAAAPAAAPAGDPAQAALAQLLGRIGTHLYWLEDGDFLIFGKVPQALSDRVAAKPSLALDGWLQAQAYPGRESLAGFTARTRDARRQGYYAYLQVLQIVDDLSGGQVDLTAMPAAHTLNLPHDGVVGMSIGVRPDGVVLRADYAQQPLELIGAAGNGSGTTGIAMVAILAAIAVPAYQEYVTRSQVAEGLTLADQAKIAAAEYHASRGRWPANNAAAGLAAAENLQGRYTQSVTLEKDGDIHIVYGAAANPGIAGKSVDLTPAAGEHGIRWSCHSDEIAAKLLPTACRPTTP